MKSVYFSLVGFGIPAAISLLYLGRTLVTARLLDWLLFVAGTLIAWVTATSGPKGLSMVEAYSVTALIYGYLMLFQKWSTQTRPACMLFTLCFVSLLIPDIFWAYVYAAEKGATVGGGQWQDVLLYIPTGTALVYLALAAMNVAPQLSNGKAVMSWGEFFALHFSPVPKKRTSK